MSVEQVARDFVIDMIKNPDKARGEVTPDATASGGALPQSMPATEALKMSSVFNSAIPDFKMDIQQVKVNGDQAIVDVVWGGTQSGTFNFPIPGIPSVPPTGKKISVKDRYVVTVKGDKVSHLDIQSPPDGGLPAAMKQVGARMPGM